MMLTIFLPKGKAHVGFLQAEQAIEVVTRNNETFERKFMGDTNFLLVPAGYGYRIWIGKYADFHAGLIVPKEEKEGESIELLYIFPGRRITFIV